MHVLSIDTNNLFETTIVQSIYIFTIFSRFLKRYLHFFRIRAPGLDWQFRNNSEDPRNLFRRKENKPKIMVGNRPA